MKFQWDEDKLVRLEHHFMRGELSFMEVAEVFNVDRSNLHRAVKKYNINTSSVSPSYGRKQRTICYQLRRLGMGCGDNIPTPSCCNETGVKLSYDIYLGKPNSATVLPMGNDEYVILSKKFVEEFNV